MSFLTLELPATPARIVRSARAALRHRVPVHYKTLLGPWLPVTPSFDPCLLRPTNLPVPRPSGQDASTSGYGFAVSTSSPCSLPPAHAGDWLKLFVVGGVLELIRRFFMFVWRGLVNQFWITIVLEEYDDSYSES
jgi:hypothetical protein